MRTHGQRSTYGSGCRCTPCTEANTDYQTLTKERRRESHNWNHGRSGYDNYGCRCDICSTAKSISNALRYANSVRARAIKEEIADDRLLGISCQ
jgi:hypothetical protein